MEIYFSYGWEFENINEFNEIVGIYLRQDTSVKLGFSDEEYFYLQLLPDTNKYLFTTTFKVHTSETHIKSNHPYLCFSNINDAMEQIKEVKKTIRKDPMLIDIVREKGQPSVYMWNGIYQCSK